MPARPLAHSPTHSLAHSPARPTSHSLARPPAQALVWKELPRMMRLLGPLPDPKHYAHEVWEMGPGAWPASFGVEVNVHTALFKVWEQHHSV